MTIKKTSLLIVLVICLVSSNRLLFNKKHQENKCLPKKNIYKIWQKINAMEEYLECPDGAKDLLEAEALLLECGEIFKKELEASKEKDYQAWNTFTEVLIARNKAILNYIDALKEYEQSEKFQKYKALLKKYQTI